MLDTAKRRQYIQSHLDLLGLTYSNECIHYISLSIPQEYRAVDVAVAYGKYYFIKAQ